MAEIDKIFNSEVLDQIREFKSLVDESAKSLIDLKKGADLVTKSNDNQKNKTKELTDIQKQTKQIYDQTEKAQNRLILTQQGMTKELIKTRQQITEENKALRENAKTQDLVNKRKQQGVKDAERITGAYKKQTATLNELRNKAKDIGIVFGQNSKEFKRAAKEANNYDKRIKSLDKSLGQSQRNVGNYSSAFRGLGAAMGVTLGAAGIFSVIKNATNTLIEFEQEMAKVKAVSGATSEEFEKLTENALELGRSTRFTSSQVAELQLNYSKLGFSTQEILNATEATLQLSVATGSDLARSAEIAGSTLRSFGIDASQTQRVVDVMAKGFTTSALDIENFAESIKLVAPLAKAGNIPLEVTTRLLGQLADAGLKGSIGGTGLKNVLIELTNSSSSLSKFLGFTVKNAEDLQRAFIELNSKGLTLADVQDLIDKRGQAALLTLANNRDVATLLADAYKDVNGSGEKMAEIIDNTLAGAIKRLESAWSGLILKGEESTGFFTTFIDNVANELNNNFKNLGNTLLSLTGGFGGVNSTLAAVNKEIIKTNELVPELIESQKESSEDLTKLTEEQLEKRLSALRKNLEDTEKLIGKFNKEGNDEAVNQQFRLAARLDESIAVYNDLYQKRVNERLSNEALEQDKQAAINEEKRKERLQKELDLIKKFNPEYIKQATNLENVITDIYATSLDELEELTKELEGEVDESLSNIKTSYEVAYDSISSNIESEYQRIKLQQAILLESGEISLSEFNNNIDELNKKRENETLNSMIDSLKGQASLLEEGSNEQLNILNELAQAEIELDTIITEEKINNAIREAEKRKELQDQLFEISKQSSDALFQYGNNLREREINAIREKEKQGILSQEQASKKTAEIQRKQAIADKAQALFNIAINTAQAVVKTQAQTGVLSPLAIPLIIASGAIQAALVASKPIPQFYKGTDSTPQGIYSAGERGRELMMSPRGEFSMVDKPTLFENMPKYKIWNNSETEKIMRANDLNKSDNAMVVSSLKSVERTIKNKRELNINLANKTISERSNGYWKIYRNKRITGFS